MTWYRYPPMVALDQFGQPVNDATGQIYAEDDTAGVTPLEIRDLNGLPLASVEINSTYLTQGFEVEDHPEANWRSGDIVVPLSSPKGMRIAAELAALSAADARDALIAYIALNPGFPEGRGPAQLLSVREDLTLFWVDPIVATGGSDPTSWAAITELEDFPTDGFASSGHTTPIDELRYGGSPLAAFVMSLLSQPNTATGKANARAAFGAGTGNGTSDVTVGGSTTGQAMPANKAFNAHEIGLQVEDPIAGVVGTTVQAVLKELAGRTTSGAGSYPWHVDYNFTTNTWPTRPTGLPAGWALVWRGPTLPTIGGSYMVAGLDDFERKDS